MSTTPSSTDTKSESRRAMSYKDLFNETLRIEDNISVAQRFLNYQRIESQLSIADSLVAKNLVERENEERLELVTENELNAFARKGRKEIKNFLVTIVNQLKDKQVEAKHLKEASATNTALRDTLKNKRDSFQTLARSLEERERTEKEKQREFHDRAAKNLLVWQELELRDVATEERDRIRPLNKVKAQQLREVQQKEAEQLRELQHLKAKFNLDQFNMEMDFIERFELSKAKQLIDIQTMERRQKLQKQELKRRIMDLKEEARNLKEQEVNDLKMEQVRERQQRRARELLRNQETLRSEREGAFEAEQKQKEMDLNQMLQDNITSGKSNDSDSKGVDGKSDALSTKSDDIQSEEESKDAQERREQDDKNIAEIDRRQDMHKKQAVAAMEQAIELLGLQKRQHQEDREKLAEDQVRINANMGDDFESAKAMYRKDNEQKTVELISLHAKEKNDILLAQTREIDSVRKSIELEKQLHSKSLNETQVASQAKSEFLSFVCHELRNPLSGIVAIVDMLLSKSNNEIKLTEDQRVHIDTVKHESELMCAIVNDVLDFAKIEANMLTLDLTVIDLKKTLEELVLEQQLIARRTKPDIEVSFQMKENAPNRITTDSVRLRQVLLNLLSNAIKFTFQGTVQIIVSVKSTKSDGRSCVLLFEIIDTGVGISEEDQRHVFSAFSQANPSTTRKFGGTGLGLSISRALVERLGGSIGLESSKGAGTRFYFTITTDVVKETKSEAQQRAESAIKPVEVTIPEGLSILVVEDSSTLRRLWSKLLSEQKCIVETASNGADAIEKCGTKTFDIVLMDITMPVMSGDVAVSKLRERGYAGPIIALTANALESDKEHYLSVGMNAVITKPFKLHDLKLVISQQLKKSSLSD